MTEPDFSDPLPASKTSPKEQCCEEQCWMYLLGELDPLQSAEFEQRLAASPELADQLLRQAELIDSLATIGHQPVVAAAASSRTSAWSIAVSLFAIAACLAIVVLGVRSADDDSLAHRTRQLSPRGVAPRDSKASEDLLIARAWADSRRDQVSDDFAFAELDPEEALPAAEPTDVDSILSWMFIAVADNPDLDDLSEEGAANDG